MLRRQRLHYGELRLFVVDDHVALTLEVSLYPVPALLTNPVRFLRLLHRETFAAPAAVNRCFDVHRLIYFHESAYRPRQEAVLGRHYCHCRAFLA